MKKLYLFFLLIHFITVRALKFYSPYPVSITIPDKDNSTCLGLGFPNFFEYQRKITNNLDLVCVGSNYYGVGTESGSQYKNISSYYIFRLA